ncbi:MAG: 1-acyl-sn-glycerol-3-phosphate acyltransferase [Desulfobacterales bacterium]|nr:1-acyl-sn-glycerol-3-phosphate acyltransferase [Desulfobacterales bacterium]
MGRIHATVAGAWALASVGIYTLVISLPILVLAPFSRTGRSTYAMARVWSWLLLRTHRVRVQAEGVEKIDRDRSYIFISNHVSHLDSPAIALSLSNPLRFVGKAALSKIPVFGLATRLIKVIYIDRSDSKKAIETLNRAVDALQGGISALFYAEGTRSPDGRLQPFKKGGVMLALGANLPIVPITVLGSYNILPKGHLNIHPGLIRVVISDPILPLAYANSEQLQAAVRGAIEENLQRYNTAPLDAVPAPQSHTGVPVSY